MPAYPLGCNSGGGRHRRRVVSLPRPRLSRRPWRGGGIWAGLNTPPPEVTPPCHHHHHPDCDALRQGRADIWRQPRPPSHQGAAIWHQPAATAERYGSVPAPGDGGQRRTLLRPPPLPCYICYCHCACSMWFCARVRACTWAGDMIADSQLYV